MSFEHITHFSHIKRCYFTWVTRGHLANQPNRLSGQLFRWHYENMWHCRWTRSENMGCLEWRVGGLLHTHPPPLHSVADHTSNASMTTSDFSSMQLTIGRYIWVFYVWKYVLAYAHTGDMWPLLWEFDANFQCMSIITKLDMRSQTLWNRDLHLT